MIRTLAIIVIVAGVVGLSFAAPVPIEKIQGRFFPITPGTKWVYNDGNHEFTQIISDAKTKGAETTLVISEILSTGALVTAEELIVSDKGVFVRESAGQELDPPLCRLKYTSSPGESWETNGLCFKRKLSGTMTINKFEEIEVPAGKFQAFRVEWDSYYNGISRKALFWYARGIGAVKKVYYSNDPSDRVEHVLKSFTAGKE